MDITDADFMFVTNNHKIVECAKTAYCDYPTIVNDLKESGISYQNTMSSYATMDNKFSKSRLGIGYSSNLAQLAITYYWTELQKEDPDAVLLRELHDNFIILSVLAQVIIDGCKREYEIDGMEEIDRIQRTPCMRRVRMVEQGDGSYKEKKYDFPIFMKYTRTIAHTKDGKELDHEIVETAKDKLRKRIDPSLTCPMNWLQEWLDKIQHAPSHTTIPTETFFIKMKGKANDRQMTKIRSLIEDYDAFIKTAYSNADNADEQVIDEMVSRSNTLVEKLRKMRIGGVITINRLIETALGLETGVGASKSTQGRNLRYTRKILNYLYRMDKYKFLLNFQSDFVDNT